MKRGQIETIGLLIVVILIIFMGLFALMFMSKGERKTDESFYSVKANNLLNAIQKASVCNEDLESGIVYCIENKEFCGQSDACDVVKVEIEKIIE